MSSSAKLGVMAVRQRRSPPQPKVPPRQPRETGGLDDTFFAEVLQHAYNRGFAIGYSNVVRREARALLANA